MLLTPYTRFVIFSHYAILDADAYRMLYLFGSAEVMELADVPDSKSGGSDTVWVRVPPSAPNKKVRLVRAFFVFGRYRRTRTKACRCQWQSKAGFAA